MPPELAITVAFGSAAARDRVRAYAERFSVGSGSVLADPILRQRLARVVGASSLDGLDPVYALVVDLDGPQIALLGTVVDAKALAAGAGAAQVAVKGRWAVVGSKQVLDRLGPYALGTIATQRAPTALTATVWFRQILARHKAALDGHLQLLTRGMSLLPGGLSGPFLGLLTQVATMMTETEKLTATLAVTPELASLDLSITPVPGSGFAKLLATARPSEFGLLDRLPERSFLRAAGRLSAASHRGPRNLIGEPVDAAADREPGIPIPDLFTDTTGDFAFSLSVAPRTGVTFMNLFGVVGTQAADRAIQERLARLESGTVVTAIGMSAKVKTRPITTTHDGVVIRGVDLTSDLSRAMSAMP
jgi:hypothetical protein